MAPQLPEIRPEKIAEALTSFPPKLSAAAELLAEPERVFEEQASAMGIAVPPGPTRTITQMLQGIESMMPELPSLPSLPSFTPSAPAQTVPSVPSGSESLGEVKKVEVEETKPRARFGVEIVEA